MSLSVAYVGNFHHAWCTESHIASDLESLGIQVTRFQEPSDPNQHPKFLGRFEAWCQMERPDIVMFTRTWGLPPQATDLWRRLERSGIRTCSYHLDLYVGLQREAGILDDPFWTTEFVFTPDGDPPSQEFFAERGINHHWISPAVVSTGCYKGEWDARFDYDVVFVGSEHYHPEWPWRPTLIQHLRDTYGPRFRRFSGDQPEGPIRERDLNNLYATARVVVGDSLALPGHTNYWTDRYFETVGRGGFLLGPNVPGILDFLDARHMDFYQHPGTSYLTSVALDSVVSRINYQLHNGEERARIQAAGQAHVAQNHTYRHRLTQALGIMGFSLQDIPNLPDGIGLVCDPGVVMPTTMADLEATMERVYEQPSRQFIDKLELGSGYSPTAGFTHLDINPDAPQVDIVGSAWPLDLPDGSVGEIRAVDVLEHLSYWDTPAILRDWFRVLAPGGKIYIQVPDAHRVMEWFTQSPAFLTERLPANLPQTALAGAAWRLLGGHNDGVYVKDGQDFRWNAHYALFSANSLRAAMETAGFRIERIESNGHPNLLAYGVKP